MQYRYVIQLGEWFFEIKLIRAIKAPKFGAPFTASGLINIADGTPHLEGLITKDNNPINKQDYKTINKFLKLIGFEVFECSSFKDDVRIIKVRTIK